jgi:hypothetical protein
MAEEKKSEMDLKNEESKRREGLARKRSDLKKEKRAQRKARREELSGATSTRERREIKEKFDNVFADIDTSIENNKKERDNEPQYDKGDDISDSGDDGIGLEFNGSVIICINGSPKYIDIPYDSETGAYSISSGANFPIS